LKGVKLMKIPCKRDCPDRNGECHCDCERYIEYKNWLEEMKKKKETQNMISNACFSLVDHRLKSLKKKQVQRGMK
jgi:hypothetical protein